jgi:MFS family permease
MWTSGDDFRFVFWVALIPAYLSVILLTLAVKDIPFSGEAVRRRLPIRRGDLSGLPAAFWWVIAIASVLSLARFSQAFLVLKAHHIGVDAAFAPMMLVVVHLVYSLTAYPFGILADRADRRRQLVVGAVILLGADLFLAAGEQIWWAAVGAVLWGLQLGVTQGLLAATVADAAPERLRGLAFGIYDVANGLSAFVASAGAGVLWMAGGPIAAFGTSACIAAGAAVMLTVRPPPKASAHPEQDAPGRRW